MEFLTFCQHFYNFFHALLSRLLFFCSLKAKSNGEKICLKLFDRRYTATLTDKSIHYKNLLGHQGEIPLTFVTSLEQKKNGLGLLSRYGKLLDIARKTSIGFCNENRNEFEITLFVRAFHHDEVFNKIIDYTNKAGNLKVRQYSF
jgi:hypothetical protein